MSRNIVIAHTRNAIIYYNKYNAYCSSIKREAEELLKKHNIKYEIVSCSMIPSDGMCITIDLRDNYIPYVIPVEVFFNNIKTKEDIKLYAI